MAQQSQAQTNVVPDDVELAVLKIVYDSLGGPGWTNKTNWPAAGSWPVSATSAQFGTWRGVIVANGDITNLNLESNKLTGKLPRALGKLTRLLGLRMQSNAISGRLPAALGKLVKLEILKLDNNQFNGQMPDSMAFMTSLKSVTLAENQLTGPLPAWWSNIPDLLTLYVNDNMLRGTLPAELSNLTKMANFDISANDFTGPIPEGYANWTALTTWRCQRNRLSGPLPETLFANRTLLSIIDVSSNAFEGTFPSIEGSPVANLVASGNSFTALPAGVLTNTKLALLYFESNELTSLPNLATRGASNATLAVTLSDNRLDPGTLEQVKNAGLKSAKLTPQKNFKDVTSLAVTEGLPLMIPARPLGTGGTITWERQRTDGGGWVNVDAQNQDATRLTFKRTAYTRATDEAVYRFTIINTPLFPGVTFRSDPIRLEQPVTIVMNDWAYQYRYDHRKRMTHKKVPGSGWIYMVYDDRDRLVLTQDGEQREKKQWLFTKYDVLNRPVLTGIYTHANDTTTQEDMSKLLNKTLFHESWSASGDALYHGYSNMVFPTTNLEILTVTYYDNYDFRSGWGREYKYVPDQVAAQVVNGVSYPQWGPTEYTKVMGLVTGTKVRTLEAEPCWLQTVTYYDDHYRPVQVVSDNYKKGTDRVTHVYDFTGRVLARKIDHVIGQITWQNTGGVRASMDKLTRATSGAAWNTGASTVEQIAAGVDGYAEATVDNLTGRRFFGLSDQDSDRDYTTIDYGFYLNLTTLHVYVGGTQITTLPTTTLVVGDRLRIAREGGQVGFYRNGIKVYPTGSTTLANTGALLADLSIYTPGGSISRLRLSAAQTQQQLIARRQTYDHAGRLLQTWHRLNSGPEILLVKNEYNELGQLVDKKLHSTTAAGSDAKQSVDYRYNIRGWMTSINNATLTSDNGTTNNETTDLFGMNLAYNTSLGIAAEPQFSGNISAISYSKDQGKGTIKQAGYGYAYDALERLTAGAHQQKGMGNWTAAEHDEREISYDRNGNIKTLQRRGTGGAVIDNLTYRYTNTDITPGNRLVAVEDLATAGDVKAEGFQDGFLGRQDYTYDLNGNMTRDLNKGIGTHATDAANVITYNHLNLPQTVSKGGSTIRYVYSATGTKLAQQVTSGAAQKRTDYIGELIYEDSVLQFINHEEGRLMMAQTNLVYTHSFDVVDEAAMTAMTTTLSTYQHRGEQYVVAAPTGTTAGSGVMPIGGAIEGLTAGDRYRIRVKAYTRGDSPAYLHARIKSGTTVQKTLTALLPTGDVNEAWIELVIKVPAGANLSLEAGVAWNTVKTTDRLYINALEITQLETTAPEYQYHLKDHLGNVRLTFTTKEEVNNNKATLEDVNASAERSQFGRCDDVSRVRSAIFDHTNDANTTSTEGYAIRLRGGDKEKTGLIKTLSVMPGDVVTMKVFAKYLGSDQTQWSAALNTLMGVVLNPANGHIVDGPGFATQGYTPSPLMGLNGTSGSAGTGPKAYLNYIMFDRDFNPILDDVSQTNFKRVTTAARENGQSLGAGANGAAHEQLSASVTVKQAGYLYIYLSNEEASPMEVYFDDFEVTHTLGPVVQSQEYYPFGLTFNTYNREHATPQNFLYNGKELQDELNLGWYDYQARQYDPAIGRWMAVDPLYDLSRRWSPYTYCYDNPLLFIDPDGMFGDFYDQNGKKLGNDGIEDGKVFVVTDKQEAASIKSTNKRGGTTQVNQVSSAIQLPSASVRAEMGNAVDRSNAANASVSDTRGGFHEEGGVYGLDANGNQVAAAAQPGEVANPKTDKHAEIDVWSGDTGNVSEAQGTYHVHPSGEVVDRPPANSAMGTTYTHGFDQSPSNQDIGVATNAFNNPASATHTSGNSYVLGARSGTVSIYNQCGTIATFPLKQFREIGNTP